MTRLVPCGSSGVLPGALHTVQANIGFRWGIRTVGTWPFSEGVIAYGTIP